MDGAGRPPSGRGLRVRAVKRPLAAQGGPRTVESDVSGASRRPSPSSGPVDPERGPDDGGGAEDGVAVRAPSEARGGSRPPDDCRTCCWTSGDAPETFWGKAGLGAACGSQGEAPVSEDAPGAEAATPLCGRAVPVLLVAERRGRRPWSGRVCVRV